MTEAINCSDGLNSAPAIVRIYIDDRNDNGPIMETSQNEITVSGGRLTKPFVLKVFKYFLGEWIGREKQGEDESPFL